MLLSNITAFRKVSATSQSEAGFKDENDPEIDRLYNSSPPIEEPYGSFDFDEMITIENMRPTIDKLKQAESKEKRGVKDVLEKTPPRDKNAGGNKDKDKEILMHFAVQDQDKFKSNVSGLTKLLKESKHIAGSSAAGVERGMVSLLIYLPDYEEMNVKVKSDITILELINQCLLKHKSMGLRPPLEYNAIYKYEIRIHEGDGEPDRDFPAIEGNKTIKLMGLDEYCLCEKDGDVGRPSNRKMSAAPQMMIGGPPKVVDRDSFHSDVEDDDMNKESSEGGGREDQVVTIIFPGGMQMDVMASHSMRMVDLLSKVAEKHRIRLLTGEFIFVMSKQDQQRLMLMSPVVDNKATVHSIGATVFEIHNKTYADSARVYAAKKKLQSVEKAQKTSDSTVETFKFTDATANAYKDWLVVKKNRFGRKQERVFGVDGKRIYNTRRGQSRNDAAVGVQRAEREISTIRNIEVLPNDHSTFRITWLDEKDVYNIEYTCDAPRECNEIVAKVTFLMNRLKAKR